MRLVLCALLLFAASCEDAETLSGPRALAPAEEPAVVRLGTDRYLCSGTLIAPRVVLTARHCIKSRSDAISVVAGTGPPIRAIDREVARGADLGLLLLERAPDNIAPLRLPPAGIGPPARKALLRVVGFGVSGSARDDAPPKHVAFAHLVDEDDDKLYFRAAPNAVCAGDSGGPIVARDASGGEVVVAVAVSTMHLGDGVSRQCGAVLTGTRVDRHLDFIKAFLARAADGTAPRGDECTGEKPCAPGGSGAAAMTTDDEESWPISRIVYFVFFMIVIGLITRRLMARRRNPP